jgi:hypothetical protein
VHFGPGLWSALAVRPRRICIAAGFQPRVATTVHAGVDIRYTVLVVRDGEHLCPRVAAAISAVRSVSTGLPAHRPPRFGALTRRFLAACDQGNEDVVHDLAQDMVGDGP